MEGCNRVHGNGRLQLCVRQVRALALRLLSECDGHVGRVEPAEQRYFILVKPVVGERAYLPGAPCHPPRQYIV